MPAVSPAEWIERQSVQMDNRSWCNDPHVNAVHEAAMRRAVSAVWPGGPISLLIDVGGGDGYQTKWMAETFDVGLAVAVDELEWKPWLGGGRVRQFRLEAANLTDHFQSVPGVLATSINALPSMENWQDVLAEMAKIAPHVLVFGDFSDPTPPWLKNTPHIVPVPYSQLMLVASACGLEVEKEAAGTWWHRKPFLFTPSWMHPYLVKPAIALETMTTARMRAKEARHSAILFRSTLTSP